MYNLQNKTIMITGSTSGLGDYTARELAKYGATLLLHGRNIDKLNKLAESIKNTTGNPNIHLYRGDFSSLQSVESMADELLANESKLHVLINNAGIGGGSTGLREVSQDGFELRFAVNYLASFHLTRKLLPLLKQSAPARIVNVASAGQSPLNFTDVMLEKKYDPWQAYAQSKLAMVMMTFDFAEELKKSGVSVTTLHPATYMDTFMVRESHINPINTVKSGADPTIRLAVSDQLEGITGKYFNQEHESRANSQAYDNAARQNLKTVTENLISQVLN